MKSENTMLREYMLSIASSGGKATYKKHGKKHFSAMGISGARKRWGRRDYEMLKKIALKSKNHFSFTICAKEDAVAKLQSAVSEKKVKKLPCVICKKTKKIHGHHFDYSKPLDVIWLCDHHHIVVHEIIRHLFKDRKEKKKLQKTIIKFLCQGLSIRMVANKLGKSVKSVSKVWHIFADAEERKAREKNIR